MPKALLAKRVSPTPQGVRQRLQLTKSFLVRKEFEYEMLKNQIVLLREALAAQTKEQT